MNCLDWVWRGCFNSDAEKGYSKVNEPGVGRANDQTQRIIDAALPIYKKKNQSDLQTNRWIDGIPVFKLKVKEQFECKKCGREFMNSRNLEDHFFCMKA